MPALHKPTLRVISALNLISEHEEGLSLAECARYLNIPAGTLHPILQTLHKKKYLTYNKSSFTYTVGIRLFLTGTGYAAHSRPYDEVQKILRAAADECGETIHLGILEAGDILYLAKADSTNPIRMYSAAGRRLPAYATALGKILLADFSFDQLRALYPNGLYALTKSTITSFDILYEQIQMAAKEKLAYDREESTESIFCIAVPIKKAEKTLAALSVSIPVFRCNNKNRNIEKILQQASFELEKLLPYLNWDN